MLDRLFAENMFTGMADYEASIAPLKRRLFSQLAPAGGAAGRPLEVVEIGAGTGPNLPFYPEKAHTRVTAVDPNAFMRPYFLKNLAAGGWPDDAVTWREGVAEALPLPDASADAVVCTLVLCSVGDVGAAVAEAARVLRPGGRLLFIEHTTAAVDRAPLVWAAQRVFNPLQRAFADGCNLTRDPLPAIEGAGFSGVEATRFEVEGASLIAPHVAGIAVL